MDIWIVRSETLGPDEKVWVTLQYKGQHPCTLHQQQKTPMLLHWGGIYNDLIGRGNRFYPCFCAEDFNSSLATITISTRRLAARPASVSLSAIGSEKPLPMVTNLDEGTP